MFIFQWIDVQMSLHDFWLRKGPSIKYVRNSWVMGGHPKCVQLRKGGGGVKPYVYVRTCTIYFRVFDLNL